MITILNIINIRAEGGLLQSAGTHIKNHKKKYIGLVVGLILALGGYYGYKHYKKNTVDSNISPEVTLQQQ